MQTMRKGMSFPFRFANGRVSSTADTQEKSSKLLENIRGFLLKQVKTAIWDSREGTTYKDLLWDPADTAYWQEAARTVKEWIEKRFGDVEVVKAGVVKIDDQPYISLTMFDTRYSNPMEMKVPIREGGLV